MLEEPLKPLELKPLELVVFREVMAQAVVADRPTMDWVHPF
jgi:hypothetical protein